MKTFALWILLASVAFADGAMFPYLPPSRSGSDLPPSRSGPSNYREVVVVQPQPTVIYVQPEYPQPMPYYPGRYQPVPYSDMRPNMRPMPTHGSFPMPTHGSYPMPNYGSRPTPHHGVQPVPVFPQPVHEVPIHRRGSVGFLSIHVSLFSR